MELIYIIITTYHNIGTVTWGYFAPCMVTAQKRTSYFIIKMNPTSHKFAQKFKKEKSIFRFIESYLIFIPKSLWSSFIIIKVAMYVLG